MTCVCYVAIQFVLSDEFSHMRPEERQQLLHVSLYIHAQSYKYDEYILIISFCLICRKALVLE